MFDYNTTVGYEKFSIQPSRVYCSMMNISVIKQDSTHQKNAINSAVCKESTKAKKKIDDHKARGYSKSRSEKAVKGR